MNVQSIQLISNNICFGPQPEPEEEVEQRLTINKSGRVWFSAQQYQYLEFGHFRSRRQQIGMSVSDARFLLSLLDRLEEQPMVTDCGPYDLTLRYDNGAKREIHGSLIGDATVEHDGVPVSLTKLMRRMVPVEQLFAFDGDMTEDYAGYAEILEFSKVWEAKFHSAEFPVKEFEESFGVECAGLGFRRGMRMLDFLPERASVDYLGCLAYTKWDEMMNSASEISFRYGAKDEYLSILVRMKELSQLANKK